MGELKKIQEQFSKLPTWQKLVFVGVAMLGAYLLYRQFHSSGTAASSDSTLPTGGIDPNSTAGNGGGPGGSWGGTSAGGGGGGSTGTGTGGGTGTSTPTNPVPIATPQVTSTPVGTVAFNPDLPSGGGASPVNVGPENYTVNQFGGLGLGLGGPTDQGQGVWSGGSGTPGQSLQQLYQQLGWSQAGGGQQATNPTQFQSQQFLGTGTPNNTLNQMFPPSTFQNIVL